VVWVVTDRKDRGNFAHGFAQNAYRAWQLSGIMRDGVRLNFSDVDVHISEMKTLEYTRQCLFNLLAALGRGPKKRGNRKLNGKLNGHGNGKRQR
jgi:hypothetical protein